MAGVTENGSDDPTYTCLQYQCDRRGKFEQKNVQKPHIACSLFIHSLQPDLHKISQEVLLETFSVELLQVEDGQVEVHLLRKIENGLCWGRRVQLQRVIVVVWSRQQLWKTELKAGKRKSK